MGANNDLLVGGDGTDTLDAGPGKNVLVGGNVPNQWSDNFLHQVLQAWAANRSKDIQFPSGLSDNHVVDSLFESSADNWLLLGAGDINPI